MNKEQEKNRVDRWEKTGLLEGLTYESQAELSAVFEELYLYLVVKNVKRPEPVQEFLNGTLFPIARRIHEGLNGKKPMPSVPWLINDYERYINEHNCFPLKGIDGHEKMATEAEICVNYVEHIVKTL